MQQERKYLRVYTVELTYMFIDCKLRSFQFCRALERIEALLETPNR